MSLKESKPVVHDIEVRSEELWTHEWTKDCGFVSFGNFFYLLTSKGTFKSGLLMDAQTGKFQKIFSEKSDVLSQKFDESGQLLINGCRDGNIRFVDLRQSLKKNETKYKQSPGICSLILLQNDFSVMAASMDGSVSFVKKFTIRYTCGTEEKKKLY